MVVSLIQQARSEGIELYLQDGNLRFRAHGQPLSPELKQSLQTRKSAIISFLQDHQEPVTTGPEPQPDKYGSPAPLTHSQKRMFYLNQLLEGGSQYNMATSFRLRGQLDVEKLEDILTQILARHTVLRTRYSLIDGEPRQSISSDCALPLQNHPLSPSSPLEETLAKLAEIPFDLEKEIPVRVYLVQEDSDRNTLLFVFHHICFDGWSYQILFREISTLFSGKTLASVPLQMVDIARWQNDNPDSYLSRSSLDFWQNTLAGVESLNSVPTDYPRPPEQSYQAQSLTRMLSPELAKQLQLFAQKQQITTFSLLQAAFSLLISRWSGRSEAVTGTPVSGRHTPDVEGMIGLFVNTLPLRIKLQAEESFRHYITRIQNQLQDTFRHQDIPFEVIVGELVKDRDPGFPPVIQILFAMNSGTTDQLDIPGVICAPQTVYRNNVNFELELYVDDHEDNIEFSWNYLEKLYSASTIAELHNSFVTLLSRALTTPDTAVSSLSICPEASQAAIARWNSDHLPVKEGETFLDRFSRSVKNHPQAIACKTEQDSWSYQELDRLSNDLAGQLVALGASPDVLIGLSLAQSFQMILAILAIHKAGAAYVPLDPQFPPSRLRQILNSCRPSIILGNADSPELLHQETGYFLDLDRITLSRDVVDGSHQSISATSDNLAPDDLAYVIFTSGSTGTPKGVMVEHGNLNNFLAGLERDMPLQPGMVVPLITAASFDVHVVEVQHVLACGGTIALLDLPALTDPEIMARQFEELKISHAHATPATWQMLIDHNWKPATPLKLYSGGDSLPCHLKDSLLATCPGNRLWNFYGPTEATVYVSMQEMTSQAKTVSVGRALPNNRFHILDDSMNPTPLGVTGELFISGVNLARGYYDQEELTSERFVAHPLTGERLYRTGDLARWRTGDKAAAIDDRVGTVEILGRLDFQVKLRGHRIELGDIEKHLCAHPAVLEAVVLLTGETREREQLTAFVRIPPGDSGAHPSASETSPQQIRDFLSSRLPSYMIPQQIIPLDSFPLTANRKTDRKALLETKQDFSTTKLLHQELPSSEIECVLALIWQDLLDKAQVDIQSSFFELGGHSLLAIKMLSQVENKTGVKISLRSLLSTPNILGLAQLVSSVLASRNLSETTVETLI
ncbi:non-ribosomal peptide synthetase [Kiloniella laminariae]|uniref:non-ribosomal peptide synthetase n=1 Tax=Kiloniella laminariae TaxID=454162 RepID=UPI0003743C6C|nr:non-ribosomal peptide synthetase [Kiloniella laminariae]